MKTMNRTHFFILMLSAASLFTLTACKNGKPSEEGHTRALRQINNAYEERNYEELLQLADSLCNIGELSEAEAYYWQGYASDHTNQLRMAEFYWKTAIAQTSNSTEPEDLAIYAKSASRLANVLGIRGEYDAVLDMAKPVVKRLEELKCDTTSDYNNLLLIMGLCQSRFGLSKDTANDSYERAYQTHMNNIEQHRSDEAYKNAIAGVVNIAFNYNETQEYKEAIVWIDRYGELIRQYEQRNGADPNYVDRQWARYDIYRAIALDGQGKKDEAAKVYDHYLTTNTVIHPRAALPLSTTWQQQDAGQRPPTTMHSSTSRSATRTTPSRISRRWCCRSSRLTCWLSAVTPQWLSLSTSATRSTPPLPRHAVRMPKNCRPSDKRPLLWPMMRPIASVCAPSTCW